ncbi:DASS family sodium-coupled anion symporter [Escherichia coli]
MESLPTARSAGTIYPVIRNLPALYGSSPHDESARKIGAYLMWTAMSTTCVTSSFFLSALAPNLLSIALIEQQTGILIGWTDWFIALLPTGIILWSVTPLLGYYLYPPTEKKNDQVPVWAKKQLSQMGRLTIKEVILILLVVGALILWIGCSEFIEPAIASLVIIALMILTDIISWDDIVSNKNAWNTFFWFATLVGLASGLSEVGFVRWAGDQIASVLSGVGEAFTILALVVLYFFLHYFFASGTAHVTALLPLMIAVVSQMEGVNIMAFSLLLCGTQGIMGVITPYATGPSPIYYGSGYIQPSEYWRLGFVFGVIYFLVYIIIEYPWLKYLFGGAL